MRKPATLRKRLEQLKARIPAEPTSWLVIYDVATRQPINGPIAESAKVVFYIPDNGREKEGHNV